jgi:hypothetical protein
VALFYGIKPISQQISRHTHEARFLRISAVSMSQIATVAKLKFLSDEIYAKS